MSEQFVISCHHCKLQIAVTNAHVGVEVKCPGCDKNVQVLPHMKAAKVEASIPEVRREFQPDELELLKPHGILFFGPLGAPTNKNRWEFALMAQLFEEAVGPLEPLVEVANKRGHKPYRWRFFRKKPVRRFVAFVNDKTEELFALQNRLNEIFANELQLSLYSDSVGTMVNFSERLKSILDDLQAYFESLVSQELPGEHPYPEVFHYLQGWVAHIIGTIQWLVGQLNGIATAGKVTVPMLDFQYSFVPHDLNVLLNLKMHLPQGKAFS
ncbi:MAG: hypothetical protein BWY17_04417 [Deltaproteobacteria bacterium ADurb.Bin207]|nr:MAG: hypothetical protein BWY17_04417 [Deltaproteobacteria bacterium ADurb.Bin207]